MFSVAPALQPGGLSILPDKEDLSGLEMVQRLAKDGCRFLQHHNKGPEKTTEVRKCHNLPLLAFEKSFSYIWFLFNMNSKYKSNSIEQ